jgi:uroporphyrinogen-III synthase
MAACVGPGSARALLDAGVPAELVIQPPADAQSLDSEHLWPLLAERDWAGKLVLILRGEGGRDWLAERLRERGAASLDFSVYQRRCPVLDADGQALLDAILAAPRFHVWLFSSAEAIGNLQLLAPAGTDWASAHCIATHARIAERARAIGVGNVVLARPDAPAVVQALQAMQGGKLQSFSL